MSFGPWQLIIIALVILVLFGRGRISEMMGDFGKGIKSFKKGMADEDTSAQAPPAQIPQQTPNHSQASNQPQTSEAKPAPKPAETGSANGGS